MMLAVAMLLPLASHAQADCSGLAIPYAEDFDSYSGNATGTTAPSGYPDITLPNCWSFIGMSSSTSNYPQVFLTSSTSYASNGNCLFFKSSSTTPLFAVMPEITSSGMLQLGFTYRNEGTSASNGTIIVGVLSNPSDSSSFIMLESCERTTTKTHKDIIIPAGTLTNGARLAFKYEGGTSNNYYAAIDDVVLQAAPSCLPVSDLTVSNPTTTTLTLSWSDLFNTGATYTVYNMADTSVVASGISGTTYTVSNLSANRYYSFSVVANCSADDAPAAVTVGGRTTCAATAALPFVEEFNGYTGLQSYPYYGPSVLPACWIYYSNGENTAETTGSSVYYGGVARYNGTTYGSLEANNPYLYLPIQLTGSAVTSSTYLGYATARGDVRYAVMPAFAQLLNTLQISFDYKMSTAYSATGAAAVLELGYVTNDDIATFVSMQSYNAINNIQHVIELSLSTLAASAPAGARLAFKFSGVHNGTGSASYSNVACGIDNILVENLATCVRVTDLAASEITSNSVTLTWVDTENTGATYSVSDATGVIASGINTTSYTVTGLTPSTEYTFYVLANCSATDMSSSVDITVSTSCAVEELPFTEDFSATLASDLCWRGANNATAAQVFSGTALNLTGLNGWSYASSTKDGLEGGHYYKNVFGSSVKHWMITPAIDLTDVTEAQLSFDVALTDYNAAALPDVNGDTNNSQAFMVIVSTDDGNTWSANNATIWQNEGGDYTFASLASTTYQHQTIDLTPYVGNTIKIAFYTQSLWSGGDNDLHIDNIAVTEASPSTCPTPTIEITSFNNRTVSFSWTSTADSVVVGVFNNDNQQIYGWFAPATDSVVDLYLSEDYFPFGYGYVAVMSICGAYEDENYSDLAYDAFAVTCEAEEQCTVTFLLSDSYGDGWNGGALDIYDTVSGLIVGSMTCPDYELENTPVTHTTTYDLCPDRVYSIVYRAGQYDSEVSFTILGPDSTVYGSFSNPAAGVLGYFTHTCPAAADECATVLPFAETFESGELGCWTTDGDGTWSVGTGDYSSSTGAHTGTYNAKITHGSTGNATKLISPVIDMTGVANAELRFWHTQRSWSGDIDQLSVYYRTSATGEWQSLATYTGEYSTWTEEVIYLSNLSSTYQVAFEMTDAYGYGVAIDDVTIDLPPSCAPVTALTASTVTNNSITLEWTDAINTGATYTVSDATGSPIVSNITGTTYTVTGLTGNTSYAFAVTANCSADEVSVVTTVTVTTMHDPIMCGTDEALTFTNADSISGTTQFMPAYSYYNYSYSEVIIPMVHLLGLGEIKGMEFYVNSTAAGSTHYNNCEIYLMNTTASSLSDGFIQDINNLQLVYSGDLNHDETGWKLVTFNNSFMYDGVSNLLVAVRRGDGTWAASGTFGSYTADAQIARYVYNDNNAYTIGEITGGTPTTTVPIYHLIGCEGVAPDCMPISNLTVTDVNAHDVTLNWADNNNSGATYTIYNMGDSSVVATGISGTNYVVTGLNPETTYTFAVEANCSATAASFRITVSTTTPPSCLAPSALGVTLTPGNGTVASLSWTANGDETAWQICLNGDENNLIDVTTNPYTLTNLIAETTYTAMVRAYCDVDDQSAWSNTVTFTPTNAYQVTVNDGTNTNSYVPIYGLWVDDITKSQFIIPATDLTAMQFGIVNKLTFYSSNANVNWGAATFNVYLTETNETTVSALADYTTMSQVYAGTLSISNNIMEVTFNTPYTYMGGNLMIGFLQTVSGSYVSCNWYGVEATGASMGGYGTSISQRNFLPKTTISYTPGTQPTCMAVTNLTATNVTANSATLSWTDTENSGVTYSVYQVDATGNTLVASGITTTNYTVTGLNSSSAYTFGVVANCSATDASIMTNVTVNTDCAGGSCNITITAIDTYGDGWNGAALNISQNGVNVASYTMPTQGLSNTMIFDTVVVSVCAGTPINFSWNSGSYDGETGFAIINANNEEVYAGSGSELTSGQVFFTLDSCNAAAPSSETVIVTIAVNDATMGTTNPAPGTYQYAVGTTASIAAIPNNGYMLDGWVASFSYMGNVYNDTLHSTDPYFMNPVELEISSAMLDADNITVFALFATGTTPQESDSAMVTIAINDATMGTVTPAPGTYMIADDSLLTLTATAVSGYHFVQWSVSYFYNGGVQTQTFSENPITFSELSSFSPITFTAVFEEDLNCTGTTCDLVVSGIDSWGDGWNGGVLSVMQNNITVSSFTVDATSATANIEVCSDYPVNFVWNSGSYDSEVSFTVSTLSGTQIFAISNAATLVGGNVFATVTNPCTNPVVEMVHDTLTVTIAVNDATMGTVTPAPGTYQYLDSDTLFLSATPDYGYHFVEWDVTYYIGADLDSTTFNQADLAFLCSSLLPNQPLTLTAVFAADTLAIDCTGNTCYLTIDGQDSYGDGWNGAELLMFQNDTLIGSYTFEDGASNSGNFMVCSDYPLSLVWSSGNYDDEISFAISNSYGEILNIPDASILNDTVFAIVNNVCSANASVDLVFDVDTLTVTVGVNDATMGTTNPVPGTYQITALESMTLAAIPNNGYYFHGWAYSYNYDGDVIYDTVTDASLSTFDIDGSYWIDVNPVTFTALFSSNPYVGDSMLVNIAVNDPTMGTTNPAPGAHYFYEGETCSVIAVPYAGYMLEGWNVMVIESGDTAINEYVPYPVADVFDLFEDPIVVGPGYGDLEFYVTAYFTDDTSATQTDYMTLITAVNNASMGTITPAPGVYQYTAGETIHFSATPTEGYHVESADISLVAYGTTLLDTTVYLSDMSELDMEVEEMMIGFTVSITVNFASNDVETAILNVNVNDEEMGYVLINGQAASTYTGLLGETVSVEAVANEGYEFVSWNDGVTSATRTIELTNFVTSIEAQFAPAIGISVAGMINDLKVYPNPTFGIVNIDADDVINVQVMDLNGRRVASFDNSNRVDLSSLSAGTYMLRIQTANGIAVKRVVKK